MLHSRRDAVTVRVYSKSTSNREEEGEAPTEYPSCSVSVVSHRATSNLLYTLLHTPLHTLLYTPLYTPYCTPYYTSLYTPIHYPPLYSRSVHAFARLLEWIRRRQQTNITNITIGLPASPPVLHSAPDTRRPFANVALPRPIPLLLKFVRLKTHSFLIGLFRMGW